jgi:hypothetical protein
VHRSSSLALWAAAFTTTCVPTTGLTTPLEPQASAAPAASVMRDGVPRLADDGETLIDATVPVILVVLDGVRWQEVFGGVDPVLAATHRVGPVLDARTLLPSLYAGLDARGVALGAPGHGVIAASGPNFVSLPGYTEIFGGRSPDHCRDNGCAGATGPTIVDAMRDRSTRDSDVAVIASWEPIGRAATRAAAAPIVLSTGRQSVTGRQFLTADAASRRILDEGARADPRPGRDSFRPDRYTGELALRYLEIWRPTFLFVGLGEPDEYAHDDDYRGYLASLRAADDFLGRLFATLDRMGDRGRRSLVLVTADHGRAHDYRDHGAAPESARVWLLAFGGPVHAQGFVEGPRPRRLADIAPTIRQVVGLPLLPPEEAAGAGIPMFELLGEAQPQLAR